MAEGSLLVAGLGGGLDAVNASLLFYAAKGESKKVILGSSRTADLSRIDRHSLLGESVTLINGDSHINSRGRYPEPRLAALLNEPILYFAREYDQKRDLSRMRTGIETARKQLGIAEMIFVDGGGDSLVLRTGDAIAVSEEQDPFAGGDADVLAGLAGLSQTYLGVVAVGLDVDERRFQENIALLAQRGGYFGRVNLKTGDKEDYTLDHILSFEKGYLERYFELAENVLVLSERDQNDPTKMKSHTAVVTYHAMKGNFGVQRTYVDWEPEVEGRRGVIVKSEHCWMYFVDAGMIHPLKLELNK
ncbi:DUF1152 domain-containing protein [Candidatus Woesearchaeota archaeon]|nr:DUF1152 domain-containing protein [Candidatus Woesearchaeota archaeon]